MVAAIHFGSTTTWSPTQSRQLRRIKDLLQHHRPRLARTTQSGKTKVHSRGLARFGTTVLAENMPKTPDLVNARISQTVASLTEASLISLLLLANTKTTTTSMMGGGGGLAAAGGTLGEGTPDSLPRLLTFLLVELVYLGLHVRPLAPLILTSLSPDGPSLQAPSSSSGSYELPVSWMYTFTAAHFFASECALLAIIATASPISSVVPEGIAAGHLGVHVLYLLITLTAADWAVQQNINRVNSESAVQSKTIPKAQFQQIWDTALNLLNGADASLHAFYCILLTSQVLNSVPASTTTAAAANATSTLVDSTVLSTTTSTWASSPILLLPTTLMAGGVFWVLSELIPRLMSLEVPEVSPVVETKLGEEDEDLGRKEDVVVGSSTELSGVKLEITDNSSFRKTAIVTGATSGIGREIVQQLCESGGMCVVVVGRTRQSARKTVEELNHKFPSSQLIPMACDLSDLRSVHQFSDEFAALNLPLHFLINNAGVSHWWPYKENEMGVEWNLAVNHLGPSELTSLLLPLMETTAANVGDEMGETPCRVINVTSAAYAWCWKPEEVLNAMIRDRTERSLKHKDYGTSPTKDDSTTLHSVRQIYQPLRFYGFSKLAGILHTQQLAKQLEERGLSEKLQVCAVHPGIAPTGLQRHMGFSGRLLNFAERSLGFTVEAAASRVVDCMWSSSMFSSSNGSYVQGGNVANIVSTLSSEDLSKYCNSVAPPPYLNQHKVD